MMSDDEEYDDELPPISVNSSTRESVKNLYLNSFNEEQGAMHMPSAEELASQRAREAECERELQLLRAGDVEPVLHTADSSGSEGEAVLASAVAKLQMIGVVRARPPPLSELLPPLLARLPQADALTDPAVHVPSSLLDAICEASLAGKLPEGAAALAAAAMCAGAVAGGSRASRRCSRRALHKLLTEPPLCDPTNEDSLTLKAAILDGITDAQTRLELADALAPALAAPLAALLHRRLLAAALAELLNCDPEPAEAACLCAWAAGAAGAAWARLEAARAGACLRLCGRAAHACPEPGACAAPRRRLLAALAAPAPAHARLAPDRLEVLVGASKLQLLFRE